MVRGRASHAAASAPMARVLLVAAALSGATSCANCGVVVECGGALGTPSPDAVLSVQQPDEGAPVAEIVVFGDSLSDTGALLAQSLGVAPNPGAYFEGRFSNGPVWVDYVGDALGVSTISHAYGGAATRGDPQATPKPFDAAVAEYLACAPESLDPATLYALWIGHNDYYQGADDPVAVAASTLTALEDLAARGAQRFLVPEVMPLTGTPRPVSESEAGIDDATADERVSAHNDALRAGLDALDARLGLTVARARPAAMRQRVLEEPALLGLENIKDACYTGDVYWLTGGAEQMCDRPDAFFHWDGVHPTTRVHCSYAAEMLRALGETGLVGSPEDDEVQLERCRSVSGKLHGP